MDDESMMSQLTTSAGMPGDFSAVMVMGLIGLELLVYGVSKKPIAHDLSEAQPKPESAHSNITGWAWA